MYNLLLSQMIKMGSDVEIVLRQSVVQMEHIDDKTLCMFFLLILSLLSVFSIQWVNCFDCVFAFQNSASTQRGPSTRKCSLLWPAKEKILTAHQILILLKWNKDTWDWYHILQPTCIFKTFTKTTCQVVFDLLNSELSTILIYLPYFNVQNAFVSSSSSLVWAVLSVFQWLYIMKQYDSASPQNFIDLN